MAAFSKHRTVRPHFTATTITCVVIILVLCGALLIAPGLLCILGTCSTKHSAIHPHLLSPRKLDFVSSESHLEIYDRTNYTCREPVGGVSSPVLTMVTEMDYANQTIVDFVRGNKMFLALRHGYRYCEIRKNPDPYRWLDWSRWALMLATLPCSDYVIHMDADVAIFNFNKNFGQYINEMENEGLDMLLSRDYVKNNPVNPGVVLVKRTHWTYWAIPELYNVCACDEHQVNSWPFSQGTITQFGTAFANDSCGNRHMKVHSSKRWNEWWFKSKISNNTFAIHYAGCCYLPDLKISLGSRCDVLISRFLKVYKAFPVVNYSNFMETTNACLDIQFLRTSPSHHSNPVWTSSLLNLRQDASNSALAVELEAKQCMSNDTCIVLNEKDRVCGKKNNIGC